MKELAFSYTEPKFRIIPSIRGGEMVFYIQRRRRIFKFYFWSFYVDHHSLDKVMCSSIDEAKEIIAHLITKYYYYYKVNDDDTV